MYRFDDQSINSLVGIIYVIIIYSDVNECQQSICAQVCNNTEGGYSCGCNPGYTLAEDGTSCNGKFQTNFIIVIVSHLV